MERQFLSQSQAKFPEITRQAQNTTKGNAKISEYFSNMRSLVDTLRSCGKDTSDQDLIIQIHEGLDGEYDVIATIINSREVLYTLNEAYAGLFTFESRVERNRAQRSGCEANVAFKGGKENYKKKKFMEEEAMALEEEEMVSLKADEEEKDSLNNGSLNNSGNLNRDNKTLMKLMKYVSSVLKESILHQTVSIGMMKNMFQEF